MSDRPLTPKGQLPCPIHSTGPSTPPRWADWSPDGPKERQSRGHLNDRASWDGTAPRQPSLLLSRGAGLGRCLAAGAGPAAGAQSPGRWRRDAPGWGLGWDPARAMELLTALSLGELALSFSRVPLFPVFDLSYFIVSILYLKYEPGELGRGGGGVLEEAGIARRGARRMKL